MSTIERAIEIAAAAHAGQKDKGGDPYIFHPIRLMLSVKTDNERMTAVLHDVVEDTTVTLDDLREAGFPEEVVHAVDLLTKRDGESREEAARRAVADPIARAVKIADVTDNMDLSRIPRPNKKDRERLAEYEKVKAILEAGPTEEAAESAPEPVAEAVAATGDSQTMDPRHPRIRINYSIDLFDVAKRLAYKYTDLGAVVTLHPNESEAGFALRGRLCYYSSDRVTVSIAERLAKDLSSVAKMAARFVPSPQRGTDFDIYLIARPARRKKKVEKPVSKAAGEFVQCPQCKSKVLEGRLTRHIRKAHPVKDPADVRDDSNSETVSIEITEDTES